MSRPADIAIVGQGLVSALGHDVATSCATARAGMTRPSSFDAYSVRNEAEAEAETLTVHAVHSLTHGFSGTTRWMRMVEAAMRDLVEQFPDRPWLTAQTSFLVSLPSWVRPCTGAALIASDATRASFEEENKEIESGNDLNIARELVAKAAALSGWGDCPKVSEVFVSGTTGTAEAIGQARTHLLNGSAELVVVVAVDSWIDTTLAHWLEITGRLKTPDTPVGMQPGEACAMILLEHGRRSQQRRAAVLGHVAAVEFAQDERFLLTGKVPTGRVPASLLDTLRLLAEWSDTKRPWILHDHNGETYRATEWANTLYHLSQRGNFYRECTVWFPALAFGDTGAASGAVALCMALRAFARGYAPNSSAAIVSSSDGPLRSVILLAQPD